MPKRTSKKEPSDINLLASSIVQSVTGQKPATNSAEEKHLAAVILGRLGGLKGGKARAKKLSPKTRSSIAKKAAKARWAKQK